MTSRNWNGSLRRRSVARNASPTVLLLLVLTPFGRAAELDIRTTPSGAAVFLDGVYLGLSPVTAAGVEPGKHLVRAVRRGYLPVRQAVAVGEAGPAGRPARVVQLTLPQPGHAALTVVTDPPDTHVYLNGEYRGDTPLKLTDLPPGRYHVRLKRINFTPVAVEVELRDGAEKTLTRTLESRSVDFYLAQIEHDPAKVSNYTELCHLYMLERRFDDAFAILKRGLLAAGGPKADPEDNRRLYAEIVKVWQGQYEFGTQEEVAALHPRLKKLLEEATLADPGNADNYQALAQIYRQENDYTGALALFQKAYLRVTEPIIKKQLEREISQLLIQRARTYEKAKQYDRAIAQYRRIVERFPTSYNARTALAQIASLYTYRLRDLNKAAEVKREYIRRFPHSDQCPALLTEIAGLYRRAKEYDRAAATYREVIRSYPEYDGCADAQWALASLFAYSLKDKQGAVKELQRFLRLFPNDDRCANAYYQLAGLYRQLHRDEDATRALDTLLAKYPRSQYAYYEQRRRLGRKALRKLGKAWSAAAKLVRQKQYKEAVAAYHRLQQEHPNTYYAVQAQQQLIRIYGRYLNDVENERKEQRRFLELFPDDDRCPSLQYQLAYSYYRAKEYKDAIREFETYLKNYPGSDRCPRLLLTIGTTYRYYLKDPARAIDVFRRLVREYPDNDQVPTAYRYIGEAYLALDRLKEGKAALNRVIHDYPDSQAAYYAWRTLRRLP